MIAHTKYRGVKTTRGGFEAWWRRDRREIYLGRYQSPELAALVWDAAADLAGGIPPEDRNFKPRALESPEFAEAWASARAVVIARFGLRAMKTPSK